MQKVIIDFTNDTIEIYHDDRREPEKIEMSLYNHNDLVGSIHRVKRKLKKHNQKWMCRGCEDNFYNGNNLLGIKECWHLENAKRVMRKKVGINDVPPWNNTPEEVLSCRHEKGFVYIDPERTE